MLNHRIHRHGEGVPHIDCLCGSSVRAELLTEHHWTGSDKDVVLCAVCGRQWRRMAGPHVLTVDDPDPIKAVCMLSRE